MVSHGRLLRSDASTWHKPSGAATRSRSTQTAPSRPSPPPAADAHAPGSRRIVAASGPNHRDRTVPPTGRGGAASSAVPSRSPSQAGDPYDRAIPLQSASSKPETRNRNPKDHSAEGLQKQKRGDAESDASSNGLGLKAGRRRPRTLRRPWQPSSECRPVLHLIPLQRLLERGSGRPDG